MINHKFVILLSFLLSFALLSIFAEANKGKLGFKTPNTVENLSTSYWIWAGISSQDAPKFSVLYVYQGLVFQKENQLIFLRKGLYPHQIEAKKIYLTFRFKNLPKYIDFEALAARYINDWEWHGVNVEGLQIDYDSATAKLPEYKDFLVKFRKKLPKNYKLSITGLGDWVLYEKPGILSEIKNNVDEIVFQLYQGRKMIDGLDVYVKKLLLLNFPFKVGLLSSFQEQKLIKTLNRNQYYQGSLIFIQK